MKLYAEISARKRNAFEKAVAIVLSDAESRVTVEEAVSAVLAKWSGWYVYDAATFAARLLDSEGADGLEEFSDGAEEYREEQIGYGGRNAERLDRILDYVFEAIA